MPPPPISGNQPLYRTLRTTTNVRLLSMLICFLLIKPTVSEFCTCHPCTRSSPFSHIVSSGATHTTNWWKSVSALHLPKVMAGLLSLVCSLRGMHSCTLTLHPLLTMSFAKAITISAFMWVRFDGSKLKVVKCWFANRLLLIEYVADTATEHDATKALQRKDKRSLPIPVRLLFHSSLYKGPYLYMLVYF